MPEFRENFRRLIVAVTLLMFAMGGLQMLLMMREVSPVEYVRGMLDAGLDYRLDGFQDYPHIYGNTVMVCAALLIAYAWTTNDNRKKAFYYALAAAAMFAIILTGVRTLIVSVGIMIIVLGVGAGRYKQLAILGALALVAGFGSGIFQARLSAFTDPARALEWNSLADRREIWNVVDLAIEQRPWTGYGLGSIFEYVGASPLRHTSKEFSSHCDYRKFTFEAGIFGGILFAAIWFITGFTAWRRRNKSPEIRHLGPAIAGLAAAFMCSALAEEIFQDFMTMSLFWASAGMVLGTAAPQAAPRETSGNSAS